MNRAVFASLSILCLLSVSSITGFIQVVEADSGTIYIRADGSIDPPTAPISTIDNVTYTFTGNVNGSVDIERSNIIVDGRGYTLTAPRREGVSHGFSLSGINNVTIRDTNVMGSLGGIDFDVGSSGITLENSAGNRIVGNNLTNNAAGIVLSGSLNNSIVGNNITNNRYGIELYASSNNNSIVENNITANNHQGIDLRDSSNCTITGNTFVNDGLFVWESCGNLVSDNLVNGKPLVYLESLSDFAVENAGQVILINCSGIRVQGLNLSNTNIGMELWGTNNAEIYGNHITNNHGGILLCASSFDCTITGNNVAANDLNGIEILGPSNDCSISRNTITGNDYQGIWIEGSSDCGIAENSIANNDGGITLSGASNNSIVGNNVTSNLSGIRLYGSSGCRISGNNITGSSNWGLLLSESPNSSIVGNDITANNYGGIVLELGSSDCSITGNNIIANNPYGIGLYASSNNSIYHNNLENNNIGGRQVDTMRSYNNSWDDGLEGNYWSDYNGTDSDHDGIGDTPYIVDANNTDNYPLMGMFYEFTVTDDMPYNIATVSNFTILDLYSLHELKLDGSWYLILEFIAVVPKDTVGFCRIVIPRVLIGGPYRVFTSAGNFTPTELPISNSSNAFLYFTIDHSGPVAIVPEFPSLLILPLFMTATLLAVTVYKKGGMKARQD